jgi:transcriptional regulator with XRE-family HTH domain
VITSRQIREGRHLLRWTPERVAKAAGVTPDTLKRVERADGEPPVTIARAQAIQQVLEAAGVDFIDHEPWVRLRPRAQAETPPTG